MPEYLKKRGGTYSVRVPVPKHLWSVMGRRDIVRAAGTGDLKEARRRRHAIVADILREIEEAAAADPAQVSWLEQQAQALRRSVQRGELDAELASELIGNLRDRHLKARGQSPEGDLPAAELSRLQTLHRLASQPNFTPLSQLRDQYLGEIAKSLRPSTVATKQRLLTAFTDWLGEDPDIGAVTRRAAGEYVSDVLLSNGLTPSTNRDTITHLSTFWNWATRRGHYDGANPWTGLGQTLTTTKRGGATIKPRRWADAELQKLFANIPAGPKYYLREVSAIALYTGMRQNEIAELEVQDIDLQPGAEVIHIREGKTESSVRDVPVHSKLLPAIKGLVGKRTDGYLFATFKPAGKDKKRGHEFQKRFGYWRDQTFPETVHVINEQGHKRSEVNFHSFRRAFINACEQAGIPEWTTKQIVGHTRDSMSYGTYSKGVDLELLREAVEKVDFRGVDMT